MTVAELYAEFERWQEDPDAVREEWRKEAEIQRWLRELADLGVTLLGRPPLAKETEHES